MTYAVYMTETEAAAYLTGLGVKFSAGTLQKQRVKGNGIPFVKLNSRVRYGTGVFNGYGAGNSIATVWSVTVPLTADNTGFTADSTILTADLTRIITTDPPIVQFQPGDYIKVGGELKLVTEVSTMSGDSVQISVEPPFRTAPTAGAAISFIKPTCIMRLIDDQQDNFNYDRDRNLTSCTISGIEMYS